MDQHYYKEYYDFEREHWWFTVRANILIDHLQRVTGNRTDLKILNVGAATGRTSQQLQKLGEVTSLEYDKDCCDFVRDVLNMQIDNGSVLELPYTDEVYDIVCAFDVIEHVEDDVLAVAEMRRVCKTGGILCVTVPAFMFLWSQHDVVNHHHRRYTAKQVWQLFEAKNDNVFHTYFNFFLFFPIALFRVASRWLPLQKRTPNTDEHSDAGSDCNAMNFGVLNTIFGFIFRLEFPLLKRFVKLPVGVSILSTWKKK